jgi:A/G-specific adenine glycosylase
MPVKAARMLLLANAEGAIMLEKRPPSGIWGGLWSLPELTMEDDIADACKQRWGVQVQSSRDGLMLRHSFSHYHFDITPCEVRCKVLTRISDDAALHWYRPEKTRRLGLATPVKRILDQYAR